MMVKVPEKWSQHRVFLALIACVIIVTASMVIKCRNLLRDVALDAVPYRFPFGGPGVMFNKTWMRAVYRPVRHGRGIVVAGHVNGTSATAVNSAQVGSKATIGKRAVGYIPRDNGSSYHDHHSDVNNVTDDDLSVATLAADNADDNGDHRPKDHDDNVNDYWKDGVSHHMRASEQTMFESGLQNATWVIWDNGTVVVMATANVTASANHVTNSDGDSSAPGMVHYEAGGRTYGAEMTTESDVLSETKSDGYIQDGNVLDVLGGGHKQATYLEHALHTLHHLVVPHDDEVTDVEGGDSFIINTKPTFHCPHTEFNISDNCACANLTGGDLPPVGGGDRWRVFAQDGGFMYSAYVDERFIDELAVVVLTMVPEALSTGNRTVYCQLWRGIGASSPLIAEAKVMSIALNGNAESYAGVTFKCVYRKPLYRGHSEEYVVSLVTGSPCSCPRCATATHNIRPQGAPPADFIVCLGEPLSDNIADYRGMVKWVELGRLFGGDHFFVYNQSGSGVLDPYLEYYQGIGIMTVLSWQYPEGAPDSGLAYAAHHTLYQDCHLRNMFRTEYLAMYGLEEIIVPLDGARHGWKDLVIGSALCSPKARNISAGWRHRRRHRKYMPQTRAVASATPVHRYRDAILWPPEQRSKYFMRPEYVRFPPIHKALLVYKSGDPDQRICLLDPKHASLYHNRRQISKTARQSKDAVLESVQQELMARIRAVHEMVDRDYQGRHGG